LASGPSTVTLYNASIIEAEYIFFDILPLLTRVDVLVSLAWNSSTVTLIFFDFSDLEFAFFHYCALYF